MYRKLIFAGLFSVCAACSTQSLTIAKQHSMYENFIASQQLESLSKITAFKFRGWRSLDDQHLIINASPRNPYLITLNGPCPELKFANGIAINNSGTNHLYSGTDSISIPKFPDQKCYIKTIYALSDEQADRIAQLNKSGGV